MPVIPFISSRFIVVTNLTDRTLFVRQAANLWQVPAAIQRRLTVVSGQADDPMQVMDTLPSTRTPAAGS